MEELFESFDVNVNPSSFAELSGTEKAILRPIILKDSVCYLYRQWVQLVRRILQATTDASNCSRCAGRFAVLNKYRRTRRHAIWILVAYKINEFLSGFRNPIQQLKTLI